jgi:hypothetical protein
VKEFRVMMKNACVFMLTKISRPRAKGSLRGALGNSRRHSTSSKSPWRWLPLSRGRCTDFSSDDDSAMASNQVAYLWTSRPLEDSADRSLSPGVCSKALRRSDEDYGDG